jgi:hypothetical protein
LAREHVDITQEFAAPVGNLFEHMAEHENLGGLFGIRVERLRDGDSERNGVGSVRKLSLNGLVPFEETVTDFRPNELIEYKITKGTPLRDHLGTMAFSSLPEGGSRLHYTIMLEGPPLLTPLVRMQLQRSISSGLAKLRL